MSWRIVLGHVVVMDGFRSEKDAKDYWKMLDGLRRVGKKRTLRQIFGVSESTKVQFVNA